MNRRMIKAGKAIAFRRTLVSMAVAACFGVGAALSQPIGPQVINGSVNFATQGNVLNITNTPNAIINWQGFSIAPNEVTRFIQQGGSSNVLNRVVGLESSAILGALQSNGKVYLINPNGILFGPNARVDVNGLIASTLDINNQDFLAGKYQFNAGTVAGKLDNQGAITTPGGGQIVLIATDVQNSGILTSPQGEILLAAGKSVQLVDTANPDLAVVVSAPENQALNLGQIVAQGGKLGIYGALVNQRGKASADSAVVGENGKIVFKASKVAMLEAGSVTSAIGVGKGGEIQVLGERVGLAGDAQVDVSGQAGGGSVLIGGDYQGKNSAIPNAQRTYFGSDASIKADAIESGDGGKVIVWADEVTRAYGTISARGGAQSGNGGFVETSGKQGLDVRALVDTRAPLGKIGNWLLDPDNITVATGGGAALADVDQFSDTVCTSCTIAPASINGSGTSIDLQANNNITFTDPISFTTNSVGLTARAGNNITVNGAITTQGGAISLTANDSSGTATGTGSITINAALTTNDTVPGGANISLSTPSSNPGTPSIVLNADLVAGTGGDIYLTAGSATQGISQTGGTITGDILTVNAGGPISLNRSGNDFNNLAATLSGGTSSTLTLKKDGAGALAIDSLSSTGNVTIDMVGQLTQSGAVSAPGLSVTTAGAVDLSNSSNSVTNLTIQQTSATGGDIIYYSNVPLTVDGLSNAFVGSTYGNITLEGNGAINVAGNVSAAESTAIVALRTHTSGAITGAGTITANTILLQDMPAASTGAVGAYGNPLHTSTIGGSGAASVKIGNNTGSGVAGAYLSHTGDLSLNVNSKFATNAPISLTASNDLTIPAATIDSGTSNLDLGAGGKLTVPAGGTITGANVTVKANRIALDTTSGAIGVSGTPAGLVWLLPNTSDGTWGVDLGNSATDAAVTTLELSTNELNRIWANTLRIGDTTSGNLYVSAAIAPSNTSTLSLRSGGTITQDTDGSISIANLALNSLGSVTLDSIANGATGLAGYVGDATHQNNNFKFKNGATLNLPAGPLDGLSGITVARDASNFDSGTPNGMIVLQSTTGNLTQDAGALLSGKAVAASASDVFLSASNPTGVIAGSATDATPIFKYVSNSPIQVNTNIGGWNGITFSAASGKVILDNSVASGTEDITQATGVVIGDATYTASVELKSKGKAYLPSGNHISALTANIGSGLSAGSDGLYVKSSEALSVSAAALESVTGINANGTAAHLESTVSLTVNNGAGVSSLVTAGKLALSAPAIALTGYNVPVPDVPAVEAVDGVALVTDSLTTSDLAAKTTAATGMIHITPYTAGKSVVIGAGACADGNGCLTVPVAVALTSTMDASVIAIGNDRATWSFEPGGYTRPVTDTIAVSEPFDLTGRTLLLAASGGITQTNVANIVTANNLGIRAGDNVDLTTAPNVVGTLAAEVTTAGKYFKFKNASGLTVGQLSAPYSSDSLTGVVNTSVAGGAVELTVNSGDLLIPTQINAKTDAVNLTAVTGTVYGSGTSPDIIAGVLDVSAYNDISGVAGLHTQVPRINSLAASFGLVNVLSFGGVTLGPAVASAGTPSVTALGGITVTAQSPITVNGYISSSNGNVALTASSGGTLTVDAPITASSGTISLASGSLVGSLGSSYSSSWSNNTPSSGGGDSTPPPPTLDQCVANPSAAGCAAVLPTLDTCTTNPSAAGCTAVLPTLDACTTNPSAAGCTAVLPTISQCTSNPTAAGCTAVLPTLDACTTNPGAAGCTAVLPTVSQCTSNPTASGCTAVLPTLDTCTTNPSAPGCTVVLPTVDQCTSNPSAPGCTVVLPTLSTCTTNPSAAGCTVVLPTLDTCTVNPGAAGCTAVLPTVGQCTSNPTASGCTAVLPTLSTCTTNPSSAGCTVVLPTLDTCTANPNAAGCTAVLPTLDQCTTTPTAAGCSVVLPTKLPDLIVEIKKTEETKSLDQAINQTNSAINSAAFASVVKPVAATQPQGSTQPSSTQAGDSRQVDGGAGASGRSAGSDPGKQADAAAAKDEKKDEQKDDKKDEKKDDKKKDTTAQKEDKKDDAPKKKQYCN